MSKGFEAQNSSEQMRKEVKNAKSIQDQKDFDAHIGQGLEYRSALAVGDIIELSCKNVPTLRSIDYKYKSDSSLILLPNIQYASCTSDNRRDIMGGDKAITAPQLKSKMINTDIKNYTNEKHEDSNPFRYESQNVYSKFNIPADIIRNRQAIPHLTSPGHDKKTSRFEVTLAQALNFMNQAKQTLDAGRLYYEAALLFDDIKSYDRAIFCYLKSTPRVNSASVVDMYDLPEDEKFQKKVERMSQFHILGFKQKRFGLRARLIKAETERQRLRTVFEQARSAYSQLFRIFLLKEPTDLSKAHLYLCEALQLSGDPSEHYSILKYSHQLITIFSERKVDEMPLSKQIVRGSAGPLAEAHLRILHELESFEPRSTELCEWLGRRYAEKGDFTESQKHFHRQREILAPRPDFSETLTLWKAFPNQNKAANKVLLEESHLSESIKANTMKTFWNSHGTPSQVSEPVVTALRPDFSSFGKVHEDADIAIYKIPLQGWERGR